MIRIVSLTDTGLHLAKRIHAQLPDSELWHKPQPFAESVQGAFKKGERLLMICASGIVVRVLAPVIGDKYQDPAVLVLDEHGHFVIPLLSGHEGGANQWAAEISRLIKGQLVLTSAKAYLQPVYALGMGCERNCSLEALKELLLSCLSQANLTLDNIDSLNSIDIKADEVGLIKLAAEINKPFKTWSAETLQSVESQLSERSDYVFSVVGVYGVAESAALLGAKNQTGEKAQLFLNKQKSAVATCAIARSFPELSDL